MRMMIDPQPEINFQPSNLKLTNDYFAKYQEISRILDENPKILRRVHKDLKEPLKYAQPQGENGRPPRITSEQALRILICQGIENEPSRGIVIRIDDSHFLRQFTRLYQGPMVDYSTLNKLRNSIRPETWRAVNQMLAQYSVEQELIGGEKLRLDTTAVEANIHHPTDSFLLWDVYRVLGRLILKVREWEPEAVGDGRVRFRNAKRWHTRIARKAKKQTPTEKLAPLYRPLIERVEGMLNWAKSVTARLRSSPAGRKRNDWENAIARELGEEMDHYRELGWRVVDQTRRRVLKGERVPNAQKLYSIFEPHTELLKRGKARKDLEFGHMIQIQQVEEKFITDYRIFHTRPAEPPLLDPAIEVHRNQFGHYPDEVTADKGYYERVAFERLLEKVPVVSIAKKGRRTEEETERETDPVFRHLQRFRAGVEGTISFLKRVLGLSRCFQKGWKHFQATVGLTVFGHNLLILARC